MAHYAKVLEGKVVQVMVAEEDFFEHFTDTSPGDWIQCSYNTYGGVHWDPSSNPRVASADQSKALRKNFPSVGFTYDKEKDAFYRPKPFPSWSLNLETCLWEPPIPYPTDGKIWDWNEQTQQYDLVELPT